MVKLQVNLITHIVYVECFTGIVFELDIIVSYNSILDGHIHVPPRLLCYL